MLMTAATYACLALMIQVPASQPDRSGGPKVHISATQSLMDQPLDFSVTGLAPGQRVELRLRTMDARDRYWLSAATFEADEHGVVAPSRQAPVSGEYEGLHAMGLFWALHLDPPLKEGEGRAERFLMNIKYTPRFTLEAVIDGLVVDEVQFLRQFIDDRVIAQQVKSEVFNGELFSPPTTRPCPAVVVVSDVVGGAKEFDAAILASHGYVGFAVRFRRIKGMNSDFLEVPLDQLEESIRWLAHQKQVDADRIAIMGASKGAELSLLLASTVPQIKAVVAYSPTSVVWQGPPQYKGAMPNGSPWTYRGSVIPYVSLAHAHAMFELAHKGEDVRFYEAFEDGLNDKVAVEAATIRVERINAPILMITGGDDAVWPSRRMAKDICERRQEKGCTQACTILDYPDAGHIIRKNYLPPGYKTAAKRWVYGGTMMGNALAQEDSWPKVLEFLAENIGEPAPLDLPATTQPTKSSLEKAAEEKSEDSREPTPGGTRTNSNSLPPPSE